MSKKEKKYRIKIIQEHRYNKREQRILDDYKVNCGNTFKEIYSLLRDGKTLSFQVLIAEERAGKAGARIGVTASAFAEILRGCKYV
jgi:hypothetical protein